MKSVETTGLRHRYGDRVALDGIDIAWPDRCVIGVLGPNGSGKSTLFRILGTAMRPGEGRVSVLGHDVVDEADAVRRALGTVFQTPSLDPELTVAENLAVFAALHGVPRGEAAARISDLLDELEIGDRANERVSRLSGGLKRRADLARSIVHAPRILLLDEPMSGLDPTARATFRDALDRLRTSRDITLLISTHSFEEAAECDHLVVLDAGRVAVEGRPADLVAAIGSEALWVRTDNADAVRRAVLPDDSVEQSGNRLRVTGPSLTDTLVRVRESCRGLIDSLEIRPPGLRDVYEAATGRRWSDLPSTDRGGAR